MSTLIFDIGGTNMRMALGNNGHIEAVEKIPTPIQPTAAIDALHVYATKHTKDITDISGCVPCVVQEGVILSSAHLPEWKNFNFMAALKDVFHVPAVHVINDAQLAAIGEAAYGAGKEHVNVAYIGIGTGIGGAPVFKKSVMQNDGAFEPGHQILDHLRGSTFDNLIAGNGLEERFGKPAQELPRVIYDGLTPVLAIGLYNIILHWSPGILVLGGSLMNETNGYRVGAIEKSLSSIPTILPKLPIIRRATLGDESALHGALYIVQK